MSDKKFLIIFFSLLGLLSIATLVHFVCIVDAYQKSSIIYFIAKELW